MTFLYYNIGTVQRQIWPLMGYYSTGYISTKAEGCGFHGCALDHLWSERQTYYTAYLTYDFFVSVQRQMVKMWNCKKGNCVA